jgi:K(+)-stimulated pyrophosphate-energized sodium pump
MLGREAVGGLLAGATLVGMLLAFSTSNAGGAWASARRYIESGNVGGKGSEAHRAAAVSDQVGGVFKDTVAPAMCVIIKLMAVLSLVLAPLLR